MRTNCSNLIIVAISLTGKKGSWIIFQLSFLFLLTIPNCFLSFCPIWFGFASEPYISEYPDLLL